MSDLQELTNELMQDPEFVIPYIEQLQKMAELDSNRVVRIHSLGAIKAASTK